MRRRNFSLVARYSLKFTRYSLLVVKSLVTRCKIRSLLVAEVARCKKSLVTRCKIRSLLVAEAARCKNSLVTRCKNHCLLVAKFAFYSLQKITRYSFQKIIHHLLKQSQVHKVTWKFFQYNLFPRAKKFKVVPNQHIKLKSVVSRTFSSTANHNWVKTPQLLALSQRNG